MAGPGNSRSPEDTRLPERKVEIVGTVIWPHTSYPDHTRKPCAIVDSQGNTFTLETNEMSNRLQGHVMEKVRCLGIVRNRRGKRFLSVTHYELLGRLKPEDLSMSKLGWCGRFFRRLRCLIR